MQQEIQDHVLLRQAIHDSNRKALGWLYIKYYRCIKRFIASCIDSVTDAEDLAQDVFLELCKGNEGHKEYRNVEAYLFDIAKNLVGQYCRSKSRQIKTIWIKSDDEISASDELRRYGMSMGQISLQEHKKNRI